MYKKLIAGLMLAVLLEYTGYDMCVLDARVQMAAGVRQVDNAMANGYCATAARRPLTRYSVYRAMDDVGVRTYDEAAYVANARHAEYGGRRHDGWRDR